jgi:hypothetical protein
VRNNDVTVPRDEYTWTHAVQDVALPSRMTFKEVFDALWPIEQQGRLQPHDAMRSLLLLFDEDAGHGARGRTLAELIEQGATVRE